MSDHVVGSIPVAVASAVFIKRPLMYMGGPIRFDRATAFIAGYTMAIGGVLAANNPNSFQPAGVETQFQQQLSEEGRLRWNRWDLTIAAEAIGWTGDEPPVIEHFTDEQHRAAIEGLAPLLDLMFSLPEETSRAQGRINHRGESKA